MEQLGFTLISEMDLSPSVRHVPEGDFFFIEGTISTVLAFQERTGACLCVIKTDPFERQTEFTGLLPYAYPGLSIRLKVRSEFQGNLQNKAIPFHEAELLLPTTENDLRRFLKSEALTGLTPKLTTILARHFSRDFFTIVEDHPERLVEAVGIGAKKRDLILEAWRSYKEQTRIRRFLFTEQLPLDWTNRLFSLGPTALESLTSSPYALMKSLHLEFQELDRFAQRHGFPRNSPERLQFGMEFVLREASRQGHCACPESEFLVAAEQLLSLSSTQIEEALEWEILAGRLVSARIGNVPCIYLKEIWLLEQQVARELLRFQQRELPWGWLNFQKVLTWAQEILGIRLAPLQRDAIESSLSSALSIITGGPGTGKTTLIRSLVTILQSQFVRFALCSPTGRAAQRLSEATNAPAQTLHRLLKMNPKTGEFRYRRDHPLDVDLVLVDEASMIDLHLMRALLLALPAHCALILVGDADQLPAIGPGSILESLIESERFNVVRLQSVFRQVQDSLITRNAYRIHRGERLLLDDPSARRDFHYFPVSSLSEAHAALAEILHSHLTQNHEPLETKNVQILTPSTTGEWGADQLNVMLRPHLNPNPVQTFRFCVGDKVMLVRNDYAKDVFNGDIGTVQSINQTRQMLHVDFGGRLAIFHRSEWDRLSLAFAITVHKAQGSEYPIVILLLGPEHRYWVRRHLLYTAVTRGKDQVYLIADPLVVEGAIQSQPPRWQKLTEYLQDGLKR